MNNATASAKGITLNPEGKAMVKFPAIAETGYICSTELLGVISKAIRMFFPDFEGCKIDPTAKDEVQLIFGFNHGSYELNANQALGVKLPGTNETGSERLDAIRALDHRMTNGDRYFVTDEFADFIKPYLTPSAYNNGKPNWKNLVSETVPGGFTYNPYYNQRQNQRTEVRGISLRQLCRTLFGKHNEDGSDNYDYIVSIIDYPKQNPYNGQIIGNDYLLAVSRASEDQVTKIYAHYGFKVSTNDDLVR